MDDWRSKFGNQVRAVRRSRGLTQEAVALEAEIDLTYLGGIKRGRRNPTLLVIVRIASALGVSSQTLFDSNTMGE